MALPVMMILTLAGTTVDPTSHPNKVLIVIRLTVVAMAWLTTGAAALFMTFHRFSEVRERTRQFGILRMLGGSFSLILLLLLQETLLVAVPGTIAGIFLAYLNGLLISAALGDLFVLHTPYSFWLPAGMIAAGIYFAAGYIAAWMAVRIDVLKALAYEE
ncbi:putative ABC transport system permease protein [Terriglobus roseus]|uniref:Putative ABC transport system permease protein n=2 Tax=Terriglobus roseus TaxID=392734 RepID=A0A1H4M380_9BACT|nr:putative ABC transport system permease protein [Terriglobus roseus]